MALRRTEPRIVVRDFGPVWLWRDDLTEIVKVMRQVAPDLTIQADAYALDEVDDLDELTEDQDRIRTLKATSGDSRIRLSLGPKEAFVSADDPDLPTRGMLEEVHRIATRHNRPGARTKAFYATMICAFIGYAGTASFAERAPDRYQLVLTWTAFSLGVLLVFGGAILASLRRSPRQLAIINRRTHDEAPLWLNRNKDALVTNAIVSAVFLILGVLIGYVLPK